MRLQRMQRLKREKAVQTVFLQLVRLFEWIGL